MEDVDRTFKCILGVLDTKYRETIRLWVQPDDLLEFLPEAWLEDNGDLEDFPSEPGVYECIVQFDTSPVYGPSEDCEWSYKCLESKKLTEFPSAISK